MSKENFRDVTVQATSKRLIDSSDWKTSAICSIVFEINNNERDDIWPRAILGGHSLEGVCLSQHRWMLMLILLISKKTQKNVRCGKQILSPFLHSSFDACQSSFVFFAFVFSSSLADPLPSSTPITNHPKHNTNTQDTSLLHLLRHPVRKQFYQLLCFLFILIQQ